MSTQPEALSVRLVLPRSAADETAAGAPPTRLGDLQREMVAKLDEILCGCWPGRLRWLLKSIRPVPLAIGIRAQIAGALGMNEAETIALGRWLRRWTSSLSYLRSVRREGAWRHDLDGRPVEPVSPADQLFARRWIDARLRRYRRAELEAAGHEEED